MLVACAVVAVLRVLWHPFWLVCRDDAHAYANGDANCLVTSVDVTSYEAVVFF